MKVLIYPDMRLKVVSEDVENIDGEFIDLVNTMESVMYKYKGLGLAAIQVGIDKRFFIYDVDKKNKTDIIINPEILTMEGKMLSEGESCLSLPGVSSDVIRAKKIFVKGVDLNGKDVEIEAEGLLSILIQHEFDHLNGVVFIDHLSRLKRDMAKKRLKKIKKLYTP